MSLLIFDEQINRETAIDPLKSWATVHRVKDVRPREMVDDDRVPELLRRLNHPMGKVVRVSSVRIEYMQVKDETIHTLNWPGTHRNR